MFTFNIVGVTPILDFFTYQQERQQKRNNPGVAYISSPKCSLDAILRTIAHSDLDPTWPTDDVTQTVINFWLSNLDSVKHWQQRLEDSGQETILVSRVANTLALRSELEGLFAE